MGVGAGSLGKLVGGKVKFSDALDFNPHITHQMFLNKEAWDLKKKNNSLNDWGVLFIK